MKFRCHIFIISILFCALGYTQELQPYRNEQDIVKDLEKNTKIAQQIRLTNRSDKKHYELLGKAFTLQGIICRRTEITNITLVQKAFEILQKNSLHAQNDYIVFTDNCRNLYGAYR